MAESAVPPVTFGVKVIHSEGHVHLDLFAGRHPANRGRSGRLVLRPDEYAEFCRRLKPEATTYPPAGPLFHLHGSVRCYVDHGEAGSENTDG